MLSSWGLNKLFSCFFTLESKGVCQKAHGRSRQLCSRNKYEHMENPSSSSSVSRWAAGSLLQGTQRRGRGKGMRQAERSEHRQRQESPSWGRSQPCLQAVPSAMVICREPSCNPCSERKLPGQGCRGNAADGKLEATRARRKVLCSTSHQPGAQGTAPTSCLTSSSFMEKETEVRERDVPELELAALSCSKQTILPLTNTGVGLKRSANSKHRVKSLLNLMQARAQCRGDRGGVSWLMSAQAVPSPGSSPHTDRDREATPC